MKISYIEFRFFPYLALLDFTWASLTCPYLGLAGRVISCIGSEKYKIFIGENLKFYTFSKWLEIYFILYFVDFHGFDP